MLRWFNSYIDERGDSFVVQPTSDMFGQQAPIVSIDVPGYSIERGPTLPEWGYRIPIVIGLVKRHGIGRGDIWSDRNRPAFSPIIIQAGALINGWLGPTIN